MKTTEGTKKILIVSYHFPPDAEVGGIRPAKFAKYLSEFGWTPYVLTIRDRHIVAKDYNRLKDLGEVRVFRTRVWPNFMEILLGVRNWMATKLGPRRLQNDKRPSNPRLRKEKPSNRFTHFLGRVLGSIFELPDKKVGWVIPAVWRGFWLIKKEKIGVIFTTAPPPTASLVGFILAKLTRAKLVTDLRDPWDLHEGKGEGSSRTQFSDAIDRWLEKRITYDSTKIISVTEHYTEFLRSSYPDLPKDHFCTVWNGFDGTDFGSNGYPDTESDRFIVSYLGTFYCGRTPKEFLEAVGELVKEGTISRGRIEINFIGAVRYAEGTSVEDLIKGNGLDGCANLSDRIPYHESLAQMKRANVLLLFAPEQYYDIPGKAFEYLGARRQILCFTKDGATADLIRKTGSGLVVDPYNVGEIKNAIRDMYLSWKSKMKWVFTSDIRCFERRELTRKLSGLLHELSVEGRLRSNGNVATAASLKQRQKWD